MQIAEEHQQICGVFNSKEAENIQPWFSKEAAASDNNFRS